MPQRLEEQYPLYSEKIGRAREEGYNDDEIFDYIQGKIVQALDEGYEMQEVLDYLGSPTPGFELFPEPGEKPSTEPVKPYSIKRMTPEEIAAEEAKMGPIDETTPVRTRTQLEYVDPATGGINREDEALFQRWYGKVAKRTGLNPDPDAEEHKYDYRGAFLAGEGPDESGHWPSQFKDYDHPNRYVDGVDTITGQRVDQKPPTSEADKLATPTEIQYPQDQQTIGAEKPPGLPGAEIKEAAPRTRMDDLIEMGGRLASVITGKTPEREKAQAQNILAVAETAGIPVGDARKNYQKIVQQIGLKVAPETAPKLIEDIAMHFMTAPVIAGLLTNPISTGIGLAAFGALDEAENFVASRAKGEKYQFFAGQRLSDLLPEDADQFSKDSVDLLTFIAKYKAFTLPGKLKNQWPKIFEKFTKDVIQTYGVPKKYYFRPSQVDAIYRRAAGQEISPELDSISKDIGITGKDLAKAIKYGLEVEVTPDQIMSIADKPYWAHIKQFFRVRPFSKEMVIKGGKPTYRVLQPQLGPGEAERIGKQAKGKPPEAEGGAAGPVTGEKPPQAGGGAGGAAAQPTIEEDLGTLGKKPQDAKIVEKINEISDLKGLQRREKRIQRNIDKITNPQAKARAQAALDKKRQELSAAAQPEVKKEPIVTPAPEVGKAPEEVPSEEVEGGEITEEEYEPETRELIDRDLKFDDEMTVSDVSTTWGDLMANKQSIEERYAPKIAELKKELDELTGDRTKEATARKKVIKADLEKYEAQAELYGTIAEQKFVAAQEEFENRVDERARAKGIEDEEVIANIKVMAQEMLSEPYHHERNWNDKLSKVIDDAINEVTAPEAAEGEGIKPLVTDKDVQKVIKKYIDRINSETDPANFVQLRRELEDEGLINDAQKKTINNEINRKEEELLGDEVADIPQEEMSEGAKIAKREEERIAKIDKTPYIEMAKKAGVKFSRILPGERGDIVDFHDPVTGGDYSIYEKDLTLETLQDKIRVKREQLGPAEKGLEPEEVEAAFGKRIEEATEVSELSGIATEVWESKALTNEIKDALITIIRSRQLSIEPKFKGLTQDFAERLIRQYFSTPLIRSGKVTNVSLIGGVLKKGVSGKDIDILIELNPKEFPKRIGMGFVRQIYEMLDFGNTGNYTQPLRDLGIIQRTDEAAEVVDLWFKWNDRTLHLKGGYDPTKGTFTDDDIEDVTGKYEQEPSKEIKPFEAEIPEKGKAEKKPTTRITGEGWVSAGPGDIIGQPGDPVEFYPSLENPEYMITWDTLEAENKDVYELFRIEGKEKTLVPNRVGGAVTNYFDTVEDAEKAVADIKAAQEAFSQKDPHGVIWDSLSTKERNELAKELWSVGKGLGIDPDLAAKEWENKLWADFTPGQRDLLAVVIADRYPVGERKPEGRELKPLKGLPQFNKAVVSEKAYEHYFDKTLTKHGRKLDLIKSGYGVTENEAEQRAKTLWRHLDEAVRKDLRALYSQTEQAELRYSEKVANMQTYWDDILYPEEKTKLIEKAGITGEISKVLVGTKWVDVTPLMQDKLTAAVPSPYEVIAKNYKKMSELWEKTLSQAEKEAIATKLGAGGKYAPMLAQARWDEIPPNYQFALTEELLRREAAPEKAPEKAPEEEQKVFLPEKLSVGEFAEQKKGKELTVWGQEVLDKAGKLTTPPIKIEYAGYWEPSKTHPNGAIQFNGPFTESSLNLKTDQFTPNNIINKLAWNYLTTDKKNRISEWPQIDALTNEQKADIIYGRKGVKDVSGVGEKYKKPLQKIPPENVPTPEGGGEGGGVLPTEGGPGGEVGGGPVEEGTKPRPSKGDYTGPVLPEGGRRTGSLGNNYRITPEDNLDDPGTEAVRFDNNLTAVRLLKQIEDAQRKATPEEQKVLVKYVGWGGMSQVFKHYGDNTWRRRYYDFKDLVTPEEWQSALESTPNAHFTNPKVIGMLYAALKKFGFTGGKVLEPAVGIGNFIGLMPYEMMQNTIFKGIELDILTAKIARQLYQSHAIENSAYEKTPLPNNYFDLIISNVPFGDYPVYDPNYKTLKAPIHDYYFIKSVDKVRPGGIVAFVTSRYTMDKKDSRLRRMIAEKADLVFAMRLPDTAFKVSAGTEVVTDIIFLRKKVKGENVKSQPWIETQEIEIKEGSDVGKVDINEYYLKNPKLVLGKHSMTGSMYADKTYTVKGVLKEDIEEFDPFKILDKSIDEIIDEIPSDIYKPGSVTEKLPEEIVGEKIEGADADIVKEGGFLTKKGKLYKKDGGEIRLVVYNGEPLKRAIGLVKIKAVARAIVANQTKPQTDETNLEFKELLKSLNEAYDDFVKKYGYIGDNQNWKLIDGDPDLPFLLSIEKYDEKNKKAEKTAFFTKKTIQPYIRPTSAGSAQEALSISLNETAAVDFIRMSELTGKTEEELQEELKGLIFKDPEGDKWVTHDDYLSGDVRAKLAYAKEMAKTNPEFVPNVEALTKVQPEDIPIAEAYIRLGQTWVDNADYKAFMSYLLEDYGRNDLKVDYTTAGGWIVRAKPRGRAESAWSKTRYTQSGRSQDLWSVYRKKTTLEIMEAAFNGRNIVIMLYDDDGNKIGVDEVSTAQIKQIMEDMHKKFHEWMMENEERKQSFQTRYNDRYNRLRKREYDGSHLTLPNSNPAIVLRPHQKNAIWRILTSPGNTLLEHVVGAGKTYVMIASAMEMRRLGLVQKPLLACYKHQVPDFERSIYQLYPGANALVPTSEDFTPKNRQKLQSQIATGSYDIIVMSHEQFEKLPMSLNYQKEFIADQISELMWGMQQLFQQGATQKDPSVKQYAKAIKRLQVRLEKLMDKKRDEAVTFEELGVDYIYVDEAQKFKNLNYVTTRSRVSGLGDPEGSDRANDLYMKTHWMTRTKGGKGVVFATATPISNSIVEMYTMLRYLNPLALEDRIMTHFDAWAAQHGQQVTAMEVDFAGGGYRQYTRFRQFNNMNTLMQMYYQVSDIQTQETLQLPVPKVKGGRPLAIDVEASEMQLAYVQWLYERADHIRQGGVDPKEDNMLKITTEGKMCALDLRLLWPAAPDNPTGKLQVSANRIYDVWKATESKKSTQLVFCDLGTPESQKEFAFNLYEDLKKKLVAKGVPADEVRFIHDFDTETKKEMMFDEVNQGNIRILIGSTEKMGTGMNVQMKLIQEVHLDAPWTPAQVEQREGRIVRQGNENEEVEITRYVTKGTFDAYMWQILENKQGFLGQLKRGDVPDSMEDIDQRALSYSEMKALAAGDPLVKEKIETEIKINEIMIRHNAWKKRRNYFEQEAATIPENISGIEAENETLKKDLKIIADHPFEEGKFKMVVEGKEYDNRKEAGEKLVEMWKSLEPKAELLAPAHPAGNFRGMKIGINKYRVINDELTIQGEGKHKIQFNPSQLKMAGEITEEEVDPVGLIKRIENKLTQLQSQYDNNLHKIKELQQRAEQAQTELEKPFVEADDLRKIQARLIEINTALGLDKDEGLTDTTDVEEGEEEVEKKPGATGPTVSRKGEVRLVVMKNNEWKVVVGRKVEVRPGYDFVAVKWPDSNYSKFVIYEKRTGIRVGAGSTQKYAISDTQSKLMKYTDEEFDKVIQDALDKQEAEGTKPKLNNPLSEDIDLGYTKAQTDENVIAFGSDVKAKEAVYRLAENIEHQYIAETGIKYSANPEDYQSRIARELAESGRVNLKGNKISTFEPVGIKELAGMIQAWRDPTMEIVHFVLTDAQGNVVLHTAKTSGQIAEVDIGEWQIEIPELFRQNPTATKVHIIHNHPSGKAKISLQDEQLDKEILDFLGTKYGMFLVIDDGVFESYIDLGGEGKVRTRKIGNFVKTPGSGRWMEREKNIKLIADRDLAGFVKSISEPDRTVVLFHGTQNVVYGWSTISDYSLIAKSNEEIKSLIEDNIKKFHAYKAIIWTNNERVRDLAVNMHVGSFLSDLIYENLNKKRIVKVGPRGDLEFGATITSMKSQFTSSFDENLGPFKGSKSVKLFEPRQPFNMENMTEEQLEALERAKEFVRSLERQAEQAGLRFNRAYLRNRGYNKKTVTMLLKISRLIRNEREQYGTPTENAKKVLKTHLETDKQLNELKKFKMRKLYRLLKRGLVDVSGNIKPELMKFGDPGKQVVMNHDLVAGSTSWAELLHKEAAEKIYGKGEWERALMPEEEKMLNYLIQSRRIIAIDSYKEKMKHPGRLTGKHHEDFIDAEQFARAFRDLTGQEVSADLYGELWERSEKYFEVMDEQLADLYNNGLISEASYDAMLEIGAYQPRQFIQHIDPENNYTFGGSRTIQVHNSGIKKLSTGSFRVLENDSRQLLYQVIARTQGRIARNKANVALWDLATNVPDNGVVRKARIYGVAESGRPLFEKTPAGHEAVDVMIEGKMRRLFMPDEWAKEWVMRDPSVNDQVANVIGWVSGAKLLRPMATGMFAPEFAITNLARDAAHLWLTTQAFSKWLPVAGVQYGKALKAVWKDALLKQGLWREYIKYGGGMSFLSTQGKMFPTTTSKMLEGLENYGTYLGNFSEMINRLAIMQQEIWNGKTPQEAAWVARNYIDFYQGGTWAKMLDTGIPYLNAGIQGTRGIFRAMQNDPKTFLIKLGELFALAIGLYLANRFINKDAYDSVSDRDKVSSWVITTPLSFKDKDGTTRYLYFVVAKDQGQRFFAQVAEQMARGISGDAVNFNQLQAAFRDFWPIMAPQDMLPPTIDALLGYSTNKDFWLNQDIWKSKFYPVGKIEARDEYTRYTHPALVKVGQLTGLSPERLGYSLEQFFTYGNVFTSLVGGGLRFMLDEMPGNEGDRVAGEIVSQLPGVRRVMRVTKPIPDVVLKEEADALREVYTKRIRQNREVRDWAEQYYSFKKQDRKEDAEGVLDNAKTFIDKQPEEDRDRLKKLFKEYPLYDDIPDRSWWLSLREMPPEAKAYIWYSRYRRASDSKKEELDRLRKKMPGMKSDRFMEELRKLQALDKEAKE